MKKIILMIAVVCPFLAIAQKNELSVFLRNGILMNSSGVDVIQGATQISRVKNTLTQGIGASYTRVTKKGIILSAGVELGYENYHFKPDYQYAYYGFNTPSDKEQNSIKKYIYTGEVMLNVGYRFLKYKKLNPEIRLGQIFHTPLNQERFGGYEYNSTSYGGNEPIYYTSGSWGSLDRVPIAEFLNSLYVGADIWHGKRNSRIRIGIQAQKRFIFANTNSNYFRIQYYSAYGQYLSLEQFNGKHLSVNLITSYVF